ncbi:hypothetical protein RYX56_05505 [Alkalihalophilus lindianensis]|uniref:Uncharacterized protein n=1 Tax=Alkalihalophilus lindianensis TaxID=1630542 RepID=A0ABU3X792_9BACI|nr:hypothetical protein [Alkalihalophilus lindianensis]MDV2683764.1 hypothetical protein [Alkalihalophilus lindianensis]MDV2683830.1 hypothetical protein [Alkalihalophilus lindianensis]
MKKIETMEQREKALKYMRDFAKETEHPLYTPDPQKQKIYDATSYAIQEHNKVIYKESEFPPEQEQPQQEEPSTSPDLSGWLD